MISWGAGVNVYCAGVDGAVGIGVVIGNVECNWLSWFSAGAVVSSCWGEVEDFNGYIGLVGGVAVVVCYCVGDGDNSFKTCFRSEGEISVIIYGKCAFWYCDGILISWCIGVNVYCAGVDGAIGIGVVIGNVECDWLINKCCTVVIVGNGGLVFW